MPTVTAACRHCGDPIDDEPARNGRRRAYCSRRCQSRASHEREAARAEPMTHAPPPPDPLDGRNPATCEVEYTAEELEFLKAVERFRRERKRPWPTATELLAVARSLGYRKVTTPPDADPPPEART